MAAVWEVAAAEVVSAAVRRPQGHRRLRSGGTIGETEEPGLKGRGTRGGADLHTSRGAALHGEPGEGEGEGMMGGIPGESRRGKRKGDQDGERPDYLVEDEETWLPNQDVLPPVIE